MAITTQWLDHYTDSDVYQRGKTYRSAVELLLKQGNRYTAQVSGTRLYKVEIIDKDDYPTATCTCPYTYGGFCKHIVAVALEIIDENFEESKIINLSENVNLLNPEIKLDTNNFYHNIFLKAPERKQKEFLFNLFSQNEEVCKQFYSFMYPPPRPLSNKFDIGELSHEIADSINDIDIDDYQQDTNEYNEYDEEYDEYDEDYSDYDSDGFEEVIIEKLKVYQARITEQVDKGNGLDSAKIMLAIYEAAYLVENPDSEYLDETWVTNMLLNRFEFTVESWKRKAENNLPKEVFNSVLSLIFERHSIFARFSDESDTPYAVITDGLASLMEFCLSEGDYAKETLAWLKKEKLITYANIDFVEFVYMSNDLDEEFGKILEKFYQKGEPVEMKLMEFCLDNNKRADFVRIAKKDFAERKTYFDFIQKNLVQTDDEPFFKMVTMEKLFRKKDIADYEILKKILDNNEMLALNQQCKDKHLALFIKIATYEKNYAALLAVAQEQKKNYANKYSGGNGFDGAIEPILNIYPAEIFNMCKERILNFMGAGGQGREHYAAAVTIIKPLKKIATKKTELAKLLTVLRQKYNRLPAFLDELRKSGL